MENYGTVDAADLEANLESLSTPWDPATSIMEVFANARVCKAFAQDHDPISDATILRKLLVVFQKIQVSPLSAAPGAANL
jgi:hypothetical protein